jgi:hypothetical protein
LLYSCQNNINEIASLKSLNDSTTVTGLTGDSVKLARKADIHFKVKEVEQSIRTISGLAQQMGGMIFHQRLESVENERKEIKLSADSLLVITSITPQADIIVRVPAENLEAFLYGAADMGYYTSTSQLDIDDLSLHYLENVLKQQSRTTALTLPVAQPNKFSDNIITVAVRDEAIEQQIRNGFIDADVQYSSVHLTLFQNVLVRKEVIANNLLSGYQLPFSQRIGNAVNDGWMLFQGFVIVVAHLWIFILSGLLLYFSFRFWRRRQMSL